MYACIPHSVQTYNHLQKPGFGCWPSWVQIRASLPVSCLTLDRSKSLSFSFLISKMGKNIYLAGEAIVRTEWHSLCGGPTSFWQVVTNGHFFPSAFLYLVACSSSGGFRWFGTAKQFTGGTGRGVGGATMLFLAYDKCFLKLGPVNIPSTWSAFS